MKKYIIISLFLSFAMGISYGQSVWTLSYEPATPLGDMTDFISKSSLRGLSGSVEWFVNDKITAGFNIQWTGFYEKEDRATFEFDAGAVTATAWKEFYILPLYATAKYHFMEEGRVRPYAGVSTGVAYVEQMAQVGTYEFTEKNWRYALAPEAGARIPMGMEKQWGFNLKLRYQMIFYNEYNIDLLQYLNYSFGIYWNLYPRGERL